MKRLLLLIAIILEFGQENIAFSQCNGMPISHWHRNPGQGSICYAYAMGMAMGATCDLNTIDASGFVSDYFVTSSKDPAVGDIAEFDNAGHYAHVYSVSPTLLFMEVKWSGGTPSGPHTLAEVGRGPIQRLWQRKTRWGFTARNTFTNNSHSGHVDIQIPITGLESGADSPAQREGLYWRDPVWMNACDDHTEVAGYVQLFSYWHKSSGGNYYTQAHYDNVDNIDYANSLTFEHIFINGYKATFNNSSGAGTVVVNNESKGTGWIEAVRSVSPGNTVEARAVDHTNNYISYSFQEWTNNRDATEITDRSYTFTPTDNTVYTANFSAKPDAPTSVSAGGNVNEYVHVTWTDNPNSSITYKIYRQTKHGSPQYAGSATTGTSPGWEDPLYKITGTGSDSMNTYYVYGVLSVSGTDYNSDPGVAIFYATYHPESIDKDAIAANEDLIIPQSFSVGNYPNPFNPSTTISYQLAKAASVKLDVYDMMGREVRSLLEGSKSAGSYTVVWNSKDETGRDVSSGVYLYRFTATPTNSDKPFMQSGKLMLTR